MIRLATIICGLFVFAMSNSSASLIVYDGFDYIVSGNLASNTPGSGIWNALNTGTAPTIGSGNLSVGGLQDPSGQRATWGSGNIQEAWYTTGLSNNSGTIFYSLALQITSLPTAATYSFGLTGSSTAYGTTIWVTNNGIGGFRLGMANGTSIAQGSYAPTDFSLSNTIFIVGSYEFVAGATNNISRLWINPDSSTFGLASAPTVTLQNTGASELSLINGFLIRGTTGSPAGTADELRIGTTWADVTPVVVPEPAAVSMLLLGLIGARGVMRRRRQT